MPTTPCRSAPPPTSIAASSRARPWRAPAPRSEAAIDDPGVTVTLLPPIGPPAMPPPLDPKVMGPADKLVAKYYPGVPLIPAMSTGGTDGIYLEAIGIPVYGVPGNYGEPDGNGVHGLNERISERSVFTGRDFLNDLVKTYADGP